MKLSIIIPVLHESQIIQSLIRHLQSIGKGIEHEIIVVDGSLTRDTISLLKDNGIIKIVAERGRARQMNSGAQTASGDVLLFLHADTLLPERALEKKLLALLTISCRLSFMEPDSSMTQIMSALGMDLI